MINLKDEIKFPCGLSMKNRFMLAPLTNTQSHENGILSGIITDGDLRRNINDILTFSPRDIATLNPTSVKPTDLVSVALEKMEKSKVYAIVVIENDKPIGLLRMHDVLRSGIK